MAALHPPPTLRAVANLDVEAPHDRGHHGQFFLVCDAARVTSTASPPQLPFQALVLLLQAVVLSLQAVALALPPALLPLQALRVPRPPIGRCSRQPRAHEHQLCEERCRLGRRLSIRSVSRRQKLLFSDSVPQTSLALKCLRGSD